MRILLVALEACLSRSFTPDPVRCAALRRRALLPAALRAVQTCRYLVYSEANFEVFRPAGATRCTDGGEIWHGGGPKVPSSMPNFTPIGATTRV